MYVQSVELKRPPHWCGVAVRRGMPVPGVIRRSLDHGSKLRVSASKVLCEGGHPKDLGGRPVDRDRLNAHPAYIMRENGRKPVIEHTNANVLALKSSGDSSSWRLMVFFEIFWSLDVAK
ncbi:hypothetical protein TNCV_546191 [Trichonephila clavipes]|nr:hypothetical protein TNCV_546191 [Trichonephila clavipes]